MIRIDDFPSFVTSKDLFNSKRINAHGADWFISVDLNEYCQTSQKYKQVTSSSPDQPEMLGVFVCGRRNDQKKCSFVVEATFRLRTKSTANIGRYSQKFCFTSTNNCDSRGYRDFMRIDVILLYHFLLALLTINFRVL